MALSTWVIVICCCILVIGAIVGGLWEGGIIGKLTGAEAEAKPSGDPVATGNTAAGPPPALTGTAAIQLGAFTGFQGDPWGTAANFVEPKAQWIWNVATAAAEAPVNVPIVFSNQYYNSTSSPMDATLHVIVDDSASVSVNGTKLKDVTGGWGDPNYPKVPVTLAPGNNRIDITATNTGGPAALLLALVSKSDNSILLKSDATWVTK